MTDEQATELFNERAGIIEHCGKRTRQEAEHAARCELQAIYGRKPNGTANILPKAVTEAIKKTNEEAKARQ